ncbi:MFS transporter [Dermacoccaceae bacterium W4C1]
MSLSPYRGVLAVPAARRVLILGALLRIPIFSTAILLTLHVVEHLQRSWAEAGLVSAMATTAIAVSGPWRGRLLDRHGLRRVMVPSMIITAAAWSVAPFVGYWPLMVIATIAGLFVVPVFSVLRQALMAAIPSDARRTGLSLDGVVVELAYMSGPALAVALATQIGTAWTLFGVQAVGVLGALALYAMNPPLREGDAAEQSAQSLPRSAWLRPRFIALCLAAAASTIVLVGSEVAVVSALRDWDQQGMLWLVFGAWGLGSIVGGLTYGALSRGYSAFLLLAGLSVVTLPMALANSAVTVSALALLAGLFCAPTVTATVDSISRVVPSVARGEALGWHGACMTAGSALGSPLAGVAIDAGGYQPAIVTVSLVGLAIAVLGAAAVVLTRRRARAMALAA